MFSGSQVGPHDLIQLPNGTATWMPRRAVGSLRPTAQSCSQPCHACQLGWLYVHVQRPLILAQYLSWPPDAKPPRTFPISPDPAPSAHHTTKQESSDTDRMFLSCSSCSSCYPLTLHRRGLSVGNTSPIYYSATPYPLPAWLQPRVTHRPSPCTTIMHLQSPGRTSHMTPFPCLTVIPYRQKVDNTPGRLIPRRCTPSLRRHGRHSASPMRQSPRHA
jgi:hypothetical protein